MKEKESNSLKVIITTRTPWGRYDTFERQLKNERHFENYIKSLSTKGIKIIGIERITN